MWVRRLVAMLVAAFVLNAALMPFAAAAMASPATHAGEMAHGDCEKMGTQPAEQTPEPACCKFMSLSCMLSMGCPGAAIGVFPQLRSLAASVGYERIAYALADPSGSGLFLKPDPLPPRTPS